MVSELYFLAVQRFAKAYGTPLPKQVLKIGSAERGWRMELNTTDKQVLDMGPFELRIQWNGWPAGVLDPAGGVLAAGALANEDTFRAWLEEGQTEVSRQ